MLNITLFMKPIHNARNHQNNVQSGFSINPYDLFALKTICEIKKKEEITLSIISMGPLNSLETLTRCLHYGADKGYLISDKKLSLSDTFKTGQVLGFASKKCGMCDYYIFGNKSIDGETGQVGIVFSTIMDLPIILDITHILRVNEDGITLLNKYGEEVFAPLHSVIVMSKESTCDYLTFYNLKKTIRQPIVFSLYDINYYSDNDVRTKVVNIKDQLKTRYCVFCTKEEFIVKICNLIRS